MKRKLLVLLPVVFSLCLGLQLFTAQAKTSFGDSTDSISIGGNDDQSSHNGISIGNDEEKDNPTPSSGGSSSRSTVTPTPSATPSAEVLGISTTETPQVLPSTGANTKAYPFVFFSALMLLVFVLKLSWWKTNN